MNGLTQMLTEITKYIPDAVVILFTVIATNYFNHKTFNKFINSLTEQHKNTVNILQSTFDSSSEQLRKNFKTLTNTYSKEIVTNNDINANQ